MSVWYVFIFSTVSFFLCVLLIHILQQSIIKNDEVKIILHWINDLGQCGLPIRDSYVKSSFNLESFTCPVKIIVTKYKNTIIFFILMQKLSTSPLKNPCQNRSRRAKCCFHALINPGITVIIRATYIEQKM